jgi:dihydroneopterin aldolase
MKAKKNIDAIHIQELELQARIGVPDEERTEPQRLAVSITMFPLAGFTNLEDEIANTVNYASVCREVTDFVAERRDRLIETLADAIAAHLLRRFPLQRVDLELRKFILPDVKYVAAILTRDRSEAQ